ncbi:MAG: XRE family transcriptional regulator [Proteobacteria bacterium]|jgi:transcriptional regulator with XRE-family HTH domain|nr:XRE family transcriptional regulator [Pseudomonadota bacterium]
MVSTMNITGRQIRGARGLLGWKMEDLADKAGLTRITIRQIENETVQPQEKTLAKIYAVFDKFGVEFLPDEGMRIRKQDTRIYSGKAGYRQFLDHVYETLKSGGHIRQFNFGDMRYLPNEEGFVADHYLRMGSVKGLDAKVLEIGDETKHPLAYCTYRKLDKKFKDMAPWYLYGEYLTLSLYETGGKREFITIRSKLLAERYLKEFDIFWNMATSEKKKKGTK